jgi:hypothetical protein
LIDARGTVPTPRLSETGMAVDAFLLESEKNQEMK